MTMFWNEEDVDHAIQTGDRQTLGLAFEALARWTIARQVNAPAWMERRDLVQAAVVCCFRAQDSRHPARPRMPYFAQTIKFELRHVVRRACRPHHNAADLDNHTDLEAEPPAETIDLTGRILRSDAAGAFPFVAREFVEQFTTGTIGTAREFMATPFGSIFRPQVSRFLALLKEDLHAHD